MDLTTAIAASMFMTSHQHHAAAAGAPAVLQQGQTQCGQPCPPPEHLEAALNGEPVAHRCLVRAPHDGHERAGLQRGALHGARLQQGVGSVLGILMLVVSGSFMLCVCGVF